MSYIDLHVHSNASDGTLTPTEVVEAAKAASLSAIALTDHDTVAGVEEALEAANCAGLELIPGTELSCCYNGTEIHILGLFVNHTDPVLTQALSQQQQNREARNLAMLENFQKAGFALTPADLYEGNPDTVITRAHFARALVQKGYAKDTNTAFKKYLRYGGPYSIHKKEMTPEAVMALLNHAGASAVLAHPLQYKLGHEQLENLLVSLISMGLSGLEVYHPSCSQYQSNKLLSLANRLMLCPTGGSDFHGANKPDIFIGTGRGSLHVPHTLVDNLKDHRHD